MSCLATGVVNAPPLPPGITTFMAEFRDITGDRVCNVVDSPVAQTIGLPTHPNVCEGTAIACVGPAGCAPRVRCVNTGVYLPPLVLPPMETACCGYRGLSLNCPP